MKRICKICGKERGIITSDMVKGGSGDEVCKECLKKAKINYVKFGCSNISAETVKAKINGETVEEKNTNTTMNTVKNNFNSKLIVCKACGREVSRKAKKCPHCGEPTPNEKVNQFAIGCVTAPFIAILILIAIGFYIGFIGGFFN